MRSLLKTMTALLALAIAVAALPSTACAPGARRSPDIPVGFATSATPLAQLRANPDRFVGKTVTVRGRVGNTGTSAGALWVDLTDDSATMSFLFSAGAEPGALESTIGRETEMQLSVSARATLEDGRAALRVTPFQMLTNVRRFDQPKELPMELSAAMSKAREAVASQRRQMFRDPGARTETYQPSVRYLEPAHPKPFFGTPGGVSIERSGGERAPEYVYRAASFATDGGRRDVTCRFRVEAGDLRSVSLHEVVRKPDGTVTHEEMLDLLEGEAFDNASGKRFRFPPNIYAAPCLPFAMRGFPVGEATVVDFFLWSDYDPFTAMVARATGPDRISVAGASRDALRIIMNLNDEKIVRSFDLPMPQAYDMAREIVGQLRPPDTTFWIGTAPPHDMLRVHGLLGAPGTSLGIIERAP